MLTLYAAVFLYIGVRVSGNMSTSVQPVWRYDDELSWPGRACKEGGRRQSPIDVATAAVRADHERRVIRHGPLRLQGYDTALVDALNNGHTIQLTTAGGAGAQPALAGGPLRRAYRLEQLHFHWPSEHSVDGYKYPMEMHLVHIREGLNVSEALRRRDGLAILAVFCKIVPESDDFFTEDEFWPLEEVVEQLPRLKVHGSHVSGVVLNLTRLLPANPQAYVTYAGSLTSPECNEVVTWIIMDQPINISDLQYRRVSATSAGRHNARSVRPAAAANRTVLRPVDAHFNTPLLLQLLGDTLHLVTDFFRNVTEMLKQSKEAI